MKKTIWTFGLISGFICAAWMAGFLLLGNFEDFDKGLVYGYASMLLAFSLIFVAIKNQRDKHLGGFISFGTAFKTGLFITLIASTIYVITWLIVYFNFLPDFGDKYVEYTINKMKASNAPQAEIDKYVVEMKQFGETYDNPFFNALLTYSEIIPVGLIITLLCSFILKRNNRSLA
jgi:Protein of unknown function (DUF4199)